MRKIILVTLCLISINAFATKDMFGNTITPSPSLRSSNHMYHGSHTLRCDQDGNNCQDDCPNCI
jgi:hypothetical protein